MRPEKVFLGYDAVDNDYFACGSDRARAQADGLRESYRLPQNYFMSSCRFVPKKNLLRLLRSYALYRRKAPDKPWDFVFCGDGPDRRRTTRLADALGLMGHVRFPGFVQYPKLPVYYGLATAFILASTTEPWGLVVNEAMASGLPVLVSRTCGCAQDLVSAGVNGFTFDACDEEEMATRMLEIHGRRNELASMGESSRRIIAGWGVNRFATALWDATQTALRQS
jgi:glycosyltransferase involved in cell wall biosynthesis